MSTFGQIKARILGELLENFDLTKIGNKLNDAIENLWEAILLVNVQSFMGGPTNITFNTGDERETIISINDPTAPLVPVAVAGNNALAFPRTLYLAYTYVTESGSETNIYPLAPGPFTSITINLANQLASAPAPNVPALNPVGAVGWNLYASDNVGGRLALQNSTPLDFSQSWLEPVDGILDDPDLPSPPLSNTTADNVFYIKVIEVQNQDGTWTRWDGASIDSLKFRRASRNLPVASTYESYAWDVLNNRTIEVRPQIGMQTTPRYFYVIKPRRCRFDNAQLPFQNMAAEEFLVNFSVSRIKLMTGDLDEHMLWEGLADKKKTQLLEALSDQGVTRQQSITPFMYW